MADWMLSLQLLLLLGIANGTPIFARKRLRDRFSTPLDGGLTLPDGKPLLGASKTVRGVILSVICTAIAAVLLHIGWSTGAVVAGVSMLGDLFSSFVKRRLRLPLHAQAYGLDQIPEPLLPLLAVKARLNLTSTDIAVLVAVFIVMEVVLSRILFRLNIRDHTPTEDAVLVARTAPKPMQGHLGRAAQARIDDAGAGPGRGVADHPAMLP